MRISQNVKLFLQGVDEEFFKFIKFGSVKCFCFLFFLI